MLKKLALTGMTFIKHTKPLKIAQVIATFPPYHGGMGYICYHNSDQLARLGHDVTVFTIDHGRVTYESDPDHFKVERLKSPLTLGDGAVFPQLLNKLKDFDWVHLHYPFFGSSELVYLACLLQKQKLYITYHMDVFGNTWFKKLVINTTEALFMKRILQRADAIAGPGINYLKSTKAGSMIPWDKVVENNYGSVDTKRYIHREKTPDLVRRHNLQDKDVILFVGNLQPFKGLHLLIDAVSEINNDSVVLLVVGAEYGEERYRKQVTDLNMEHRVVFAGAQSPDEDLPNYFNLGDFLVLPSTHSESFGLVILEAMASGLPVITSALPGPSQLIDHGNDGFIVAINDVKELKERIEYLVTNKDRRRQMGKNAMMKVKGKFTWDIIGKQLDKTIRSL